LEAGTPTGAGAGGEDTSEETTSRDGGCDSQEVNDVKKLRSNGLNNLAADAAGSENSPTLFPDDTPEPPAPEKPNETDVQRVIRECWEMLDLGNMPDGKLKGYSRLTQLFVADGWEVIEQQVKMCFATKPQPTGNANPWAFFCKQFRLAVNQPWGFGVQKDSARGTSGNQGPGVWEPGDFSTAPTGEIDLSTMTGSHDNR